MITRALLAVVAVVAAVTVPPWQGTVSAATGNTVERERQGISEPALPVGAPNMVVLVLDDYAAIDNRILERLPNIKATFLDQGISFSNYWANFSLCCPGRATLLTGQRALHHGVTKNKAVLLNPAVTIATELQSAGYHTMMVGKYLNGTRRLSDKTPPGWDDIAIKDSGPYYEYPLWINGVREYHGSSAQDYSTDVLANVTMPLLEDVPAEKPLFAFLTPNATHGGGDETGLKTAKQPAVAPRFRGDARCAGIPPWHPANYNEADVSDKPLYIRQLPLLKNTAGWPMQMSCEALLSVDEWLGRVIAELQDQGRYENTIFVLTADNGMGWGAHRILGKIAPHTAQMMLHVSWPGVISGASTDDTLLSNIDIAPTLCEFGGCEMGPYPNGFGVDGESFAGLVDSARFSSTPQRDSIILENGMGGAIPYYQAILTGANHPRGQWLFVRYPGTTSKELYRMWGGSCVDWQVGQVGDPCMMDNVVRRPSRAAVRNALAAELTAEW